MRPRLKPFSTRRPPPFTRSSCTDSFSSVQDASFARKLWTSCGASAPPERPRRRSRAADQPILAPSPNHVADAASLEQLAHTVGDAMAARFPTMPPPPQPTAPQTTAPPPTALPNPAPLSSHTMALDPNASLAVNFERHLAARWGRSLSMAESTTIALALEQSLIDAARGRSTPPTTAPWPIDECIDPSSGRPTLGSGPR